MGALRRYGKAVLKQGINIVGCYFAWMRKYAKHPEKYPFEQRYARLHKLVVKVNKALDFDVIVEGKEKIPSGTVAYFANHLSTADPLSLVGVLDTPVTFVSKKENATMPFVGKIMKDIDGLFLDREDLKQSLKVMMQVQKSLENREKSWVIYPEGTRNKDPMHKLKEFHHGTFRPATKAKVPLVPIAFYGSHQALKTNLICKKYPVFIKFLDPIMPEEYEGMTTQEVAKMVENRVQSAISFDLRKKYDDYMSSNKNYRFNKL